MVNDFFRSRNPCDLFNYREQHTTTFKRFWSYLSGGDFSNVVAHFLQGNRAMCLLFSHIGKAEIVEVEANA